mmetsp:Transcript_612/g.1328  ORF Transcript_612/g.1328 Transcript_612/m.1328 type:complete len:202 (-) Transcript_612:222-827(-)
MRKMPPKGSKSSCRSASLVSSERFETRNVFKSRSSTGSMADNEPPMPPAAPPRADGGTYLPAPPAAMPARPFPAFPNIPPPPSSGASSSGAFRSYLVKQHAHLEGGGGEGAAQGRVSSLAREGTVLLLPLESFEGFIHVLVRAAVFSLGVLRGKHVNLIVVDDSNVALVHHTDRIPELLEARPPLFHRDGRPHFLLDNSDL